MHAGLGLRLVDCVGGMVGDGEQVLDMPAKLAARVRVLSVGDGHKSDPHDAVSVAVAARSTPSLRQVDVEDQAVVLHLLTKRRQDPVAARTQTINRLHRLLLDLVPGGARRNLTAKRAAALLSDVTPTGRPAVTRCQLATELVADIRQLEQRIAAVEARIRPRSPRPTPACSGCSGSGRCWRPPFWVRSATSVGSRPKIISPPTPAPPLEAFSGQVVRHRLSRAGDRKLNHALYMMAMVQVRRPSAGQAYYRRKLAEGKSPKEALRCLKRRLSDAVYRCLLIDHQDQARARTR
jgi:transposase